MTLVEPGPFRTEFVTRSLEKASQPLTDYDGTSGKFGRLIASMNGKQPGDPAKAAKAILAIAEAESLPLRLLLGKYANEKARRLAEGREKERSAGEAIRMHTEFS